MSNGKKRDDGWFGWVLIVFLFATDFLAPLGLLLLLLKLFGGDRKRIKLPPPAKPIEVPGPRPGPAPAQASGNPGARRAMDPPVRKKGTVLKILGAVFLGVGLLATGSALGDILGNFAMGRIWLGDLFQGLMFVAGGGALLGKGTAMDRELRRYAQYLPVMGDRDMVPVEELARTLGYSERRVGKDLQRMIDRGYFGGRAYLNVEYGCLFRSEEAAERFRRQCAAMNVPEPPREVEEGYSGLLRKIRRANDAIADPVLSAKIDRLEEIAGKIFKAAEEDPEKRKKMDTFLNYYLPTTQKLLDAYAEFEAAGVEGDNLRQAKQRIESTMDSIVGGFEHQLDEMYKADALDVDSDIRVMETMLRWDTASAERDFGPSETSEPKGERP